MADSVIVAGDITMDRLLVPVDGRRARITSRPSGALLLAELVRQSLGRSVTGPAMPDPAGDVRERILELDTFTNGKDAGAVYRIRREFEVQPAGASPHAALSSASGDAHASLVVIDDAGREFRSAADAWPAAITAASATPIVLFRMAGPVARGELWDRLRKQHADRLAVIVDAADLRAAADISQGLSWERTAMDLMWQLRANRELTALAGCAHLIVSFGLDAAVHVARGAPGAARLYYDPAAAEGEFGDAHEGDMAGCEHAFTAAIAKAVAGGGLDRIGEGIASGLRAARAMLRLGFGVSAADAATVPRVFDNVAMKLGRIAAIDIPETGAETPDPSFWCILSSLSSRRLEQIAFEIVRRGDAEALAGVPVGRFGGLKTIDRKEIESFRSIRRLMMSYCATENPGRPLSIAVFGQPGSGKSFGVSQVAQTVAPGRVEKREFNLSQFASPADLTLAFHWVRDVALTGRIALAVFDEFDSALDGVPLGWLKWFLAPMQDGAFKEGEAMRPLGRAIFVFAGGTCNDYAQFCAGGDAFRAAKGPDFASRLRGYVNVLGPNPVDEADRFHLVRRAMLLRSLLVRKTPQLVGADETARIDPGVLRAILKVPAHRHGARSMEAILDMSALTGQDRFDQAALPPAEQLDLHTDAAMFSKLVARDALFGAGRERIARAIHEHYRATQRGVKPPDDPAMAAWEDLAEPLRESNRHQADHISEKLGRIGFGFAPVMNGSDGSDAFTPDEIEVLSEMEHERFVAERLAAGWTAGPRDVGARQTPHLVAWAALDEPFREMDRNAVRAIPQLMADAGFEIYRLA